MRIRRSERRDAIALSSFSCATEAWYEREVEFYIQGTISQQVEHGRHILLLEDDGELSAVAAHHEMSDPAGTGLVVSWLEVAAVSLEKQGTLLPDGLKLSAVLMNALISDAVSQPGRQPIAFAYVAEENARSRVVCTRAGLIEDQVRDMLYSATLGAQAPYLFLSGRFDARRP